MPQAKALDEQIKEFRGEIDKAIESHTTATDEARAALGGATPGVVRHAALKLEKELNRAIDKHKKGMASLEIQHRQNSHRATQQDGRGGMKQ